MIGFVVFYFIIGLHGAVSYCLQDWNESHMYVEKDPVWKKILQSLACIFFWPFFVFACLYWAYQDARSKSKQEKTQGLQ
jgi:hypothetical protein